MMELGHWVWERELFSERGRGWGLYIEGVGSHKAVDFLFVRSANEMKIVFVYHSDF